MSWLHRGVTCIAAGLLLLALAGPVRGGTAPGPDDLMLLEEPPPASPASDLGALQLGRLGDLLFLVAMGGALFLVRPLWLSNIHPGRTGTLLGHSALAGATLFLAASLVGFSVLLLRLGLSLLPAAGSPAIDLVPAALAVAAVAFFARAFWPVLRSVLALPDRVFAVEPRLAARVTAATTRKIARELRGVCLFGASLVACGMLSSATLALASRLAGGAGVHLLLNVAAALLASSLFLYRAQAIFQQHAHEGVPLRAHARFWRRGTLALLWAHVLPLAWLPAAAWLPPAALLAAGVLIFWLARGLKALSFLLRYHRSLEQGDTEVVVKLSDASAA